MSQPHVVYIIHPSHWGIAHQVSCSTLNMYSEVRVLVEIMPSCTKAKLNGDLVGVKAPLQSKACVRGHF
jgi:hypothetical protein